MENTLENKAKFFALYWGQEIQTYKISKYTTKRNVAVSGYSLGFISLKPLSALSQEQIEKIVAIVFPYLKAPTITVTRGYRKFGHDICESVICVEIIEFIDIIQQDVLHALLQFDLEVTDIITGMFEQCGRLIDDATDNIIHVVDYLRSEKFAISWMGLSVEKQIDYGWVNLESEVSNG